jgi:gamma-glutamyl-gamma-aminobutyraldehyde dehydrogenase
MNVTITNEYEKMAEKLDLRTQAFIDGKFVNSVSGDTFETNSPVNGQVITKIASCGTEDVELAVSAAKRSFETRVWAGIEAVERKRILLKWADLIEEHAEELAIMETLDSGKPITDNVNTDVPESIAVIRFHAEAIDKLQDDITPSSDKGLNIVVREPIGVVAAILPWNFPLLMAAWKLGPILAAGNSVVVKPAKLTTLTILKLAELAKEAGIPDGVLNILPGNGGVLGDALAHHSDVRLITFTGSTEVGKKLLIHSGQSNAKRVLLEMGGKNPAVVMPDVKDLDYVADCIVSSAFWNMGENCTQNSRIYIHKDIKPQLTKLIVEKAKGHKVGNPFDPETTIGALIEKKHMETVLSYIEIGKAEGAKIICGGNQVLAETGGNYVEPTIFDDVKHNMRIATEEIFGPVVALIEFEDIDEVIKMANDSVYGLQASVYTMDINAANKLARGIQAGVVSVNCYSEGSTNVPFGGFKQSGFFGRDKSVWANLSYTETKSICIALN